MVLTKLFQFSNSRENQVSHKLSRCLLTGYNRRWELCFAFGLKSNCMQLRFRVKLKSSFRTFPGVSSVRKKPHLTLPRKRCQSIWKSAYLVIHLSHGRMQKIISLIKQVRAWKLMLARCPVTKWFMVSLWVNGDNFTSTSTNNQDPFEIFCQNFQKLHVFKSGQGWILITNTNVLVNIVEIQHHEINGKHTT